MEQKNRLILAILITVLIVGAMFTSFGRSLFTMHTPTVELAQPGTGDTSQGEQSGDIQRVKVTTATVQSVIASLSRSESYYREVTVELFWDSGSSSSSSSISTWVDEGWTHSRQVTPSGLIRHTLTGPDGEGSYWYEGSSQWHDIPQGQSADLSQQLPTYESVLALDPKDITDADYQLRGEIPCVYVEAAPDEFGYTRRYWVGTESGLLISAEVLSDGALVYRMTGSSPIQTPCPQDGDFSLPDGTVLHTV